MTDREVVHVEFSEHILTITMDRPESRNALSQQMTAELSNAFARLDEDPDCWVGILQAEGPVFCAGADLKEALVSRTKPVAESAQGMTPPSTEQRAPSMMGRHRKPVIACVEAPVYAGGLEIVLTCDLIVASTTAQFALMEVKRGLLALGGGLFRLPRRLPYSVAMEMLLTGEAKSAQLMAELGLINQLAEPGQARDAARALALRIVANSPVAVQAALAVAATSVSEQWTDDEGFAGTREAAAGVLSSEDLMEGLRAFSEKRPPQWKGR